jgi:hypothetical protein
MGVASGMLRTNLYHFHPTFAYNLAGIILDLGKLSITFYIVIMLSPGAVRVAALSMVTAIFAFGWCDSYSMRCRTIKIYTSRYVPPRPLADSSVVIRISYMTGVLSGTRGVARIRLGSTMEGSGGIHHDYNTD